MLSKHLMCQNIVELESRKVSNLKLTDPSPENIKVHNKHNQIQKVKLQCRNYIKKMKNLQNINADYENEIKELRSELKTALEIRTSSFAEKNNINVMNDAKDLKILELESDLVEAKEKWGNLVNFLNEELNLAEKAAVQAKVKYVEEASQKEFFQFKYNDLLCKLKKGNLKKKN